MERIVDPVTWALAISRVKQNKGAPGVDGMSVDQLGGFWELHGARICQALLAGDYVPRPVRRVAIPKPGGGERLLGIPNVLDRVVGQMVLIVLEEVFDPHFSHGSYGFRRGRSAHGAVRRVKEIVSLGREWVVDIDLEKYFDSVNHDILMSRVARRVKDKRVLKLIRRFLNAGVMLDGVVVRQDGGTPQGGPLSPLLANIMLDDLDKMLESRGHQFVRYADDCNIYVGSEASAQRVMLRVTKFLEVKLRLRVNHAKSAVARCSERQFPGFYAVPECEGGCDPYFGESPSPLRG
jgi:group II intron reverse transcriptase/maturase